MTSLIEIKDKMISQIKAGEITLLSELNLEPGDRELIRHNSAMILNSCVEGVNKHCLLASYFMMDVGMREYDEGNYWNNFWRLSGLKKSSYMQNKFCNIFESTINDYELAWIDRAGRTYVNMILMHAFIPDNYSSELFDLLHYFYRTVLGQSLDNINDELKNLSSKTSTASADNVGDQFFGAKLIIPMKLAFSDVNIFGPIVKKILKKIDSVDYTETNINLGIHEDSFKQWIKELVQNNSKSRSLNGRIRLWFDREETTVQAFIPELAFLNTDHPYAYILDGIGNRIGSISLSGRRFEGYIFTSSKQVNIADYGLGPLDAFTISAGKMELKINSERYRLFSMNGNNTRNISGGINYIIHDSEVVINGVFSNFSSIGDYKVSMVYLKRGESIRIDGQLFVLFKQLGDFFEISDNDLGVICTDQEGNKLQAYAEHPLVNVNLSKNELNEVIFTVRRNNLVVHSQDLVQCLTEDLKGYCIVRNDNLHIEIDLNTILSKYDSGLYEFRFTKSREVIRYLVIPGFTYTFDKDRYTGGLGHVIINLDIMNPINFDSSESNFIQLPTIIENGNEYNLAIPIPACRYSFDKKTWFLFKSNNYHYRELTAKTIFIKTPWGEGGHLSISVANARSLYGEIEGDCAVFDFSKISAILEYLQESNIEVYYNWGSGSRVESLFVFKIFIHGSYIIKDERIIQLEKLPYDVISECVIHYKDGDVKTVSFIDGVAHFNDFNYNSIYVHEIVTDIFGGQERKEIKLFQNNLILSLSGPMIIENNIPEKIEYSFSGYNGFIDSSLFKSMLSDKKYSAESREDNIKELCAKNGYGNKMPDALSRKLYGEIEAYIINEQLSVKNLGHLKLSFDRYLHIRNDYALKFSDRYLELCPNDSAMKHLRKFIP